MFSEESDQVEKYVGGLPNMIQGDGKSNGVDAINGSEDNSGDNRDGDANEGVDVEAYSVIRASVDGDGGV
nr:hypothetical protein [Tanacetum cinerariifolium]